MWDRVGDGGRIDEVHAWWGGEGGEDRERFVYRFWVYPFCFLDIGKGCVMKGFCVI